MELDHYQGSDRFLNATIQMAFRSWNQRLSIPKIGIEEWSRSPLLSNQNHYAHKSPPIELVHNSDLNLNWDDDLIQVT